MIIVKGLEIDSLIKIRIFRIGCTRERGNSGASRIGYDWIERQEAFLRQTQECFATTKSTVKGAKRNFIKLF